ncbi:hypothetical protein [Kitasatospora sp. NPDC057541]|uniref:protein kinase domain-containing protein n=1 Tax=unclassified Kitasatospora TaxID=2633591 RepID=UPI003673D3D3
MADTPPEPSPATRKQGRGRANGRGRAGGRPPQPDPGDGGTTAAAESPRTRVQRARPTPAPGPGPSGAVPGPRTRVQRGAPTRVQRPGGPAGPAEPGESAEPATPAASASDPSGAFPAALTDRYHPLGPVGSGSEGTVWHVRRADGAGEAAVKVGNPGVRADTELLAHLAGDPAFRRHVPEILGHGQVEHAGALCDWMAMEYLPVTLADHVDELRTRRRLDRRGESERIIRELVDLLAFWQSTIARNPVDFKPANILVRPAGTDGRSAAQFVVADFGGVAKLTASRRFSADMQVTVAYMAPEQLAGHNHPAGPWWALGTILYEVFTGAGRYRRADGGLISDEALQIRLVMDAEVDVSAIPDERRRLLLQGLFTKDPADRWTADQVRAWLTGASPEVVRSRVDPPQPEPVPTPPAHRPIAFRGQDFRDPAALAEALLGRSADAAAWLVSGGARRLRDWLRDEVKDTVLDLHYLKDVERGTPADKSAAASRAVLALGVAFTPEAVPYVRDRRVDAAGLAQLAGEADGPGFVEELVTAGLVGLAARFHCGHADCREGACARLLALSGTAAVLDAVEREARTLGGRTGGGGLTANERAAARRWVLLLAIQPQQQRRAVVRRLSLLPGPLAALPTGVQRAAAAVEAVAARVRIGDRDGFRRWSDLSRRALAADPTTADGRGVLAAAAVLQVRSVRAGGADRGRARGERKVDVRAWWGGARTALPRRAVAAVLLFFALGLTLWSGAVLRFAVDFGAGGRLLPGGPFDGPLRTVGEAAALATAGQLGAVLVAAVAVVAFPARVGRRMLFLVIAASLTIGYLHLGPPMTVLEAPQPVVDRVVRFGGGMENWTGVGALVAIVLALYLNNRPVTWLLSSAHTASERAAGDRRRAAARRRAARGGGVVGFRDRLLFWLGGTLVLTLLLWSAVEVRIAVVDRDRHLTPESWGTGQVGAAYQADYLLLLAFLAFLAACATPGAARRLLAGSAVGTAVLGAWPPPLGPFEALRIPVLGPWFRSLATLWGHAAFWAALLLMLPLACYLALWTTRRLPTPAAE